MVAWALINIFHNKKIELQKLEYFKYTAKLLKKPYITCNFFTF